VAQPLIESVRPARQAVFAWVTYDLANTAFSMGVVSMFMPLWVREQVGKIQADYVVTMATAVSMTLIFVLSPILGSMTDRAARRLPFLTVSTVFCVLLTMSLGRIGYDGTLVAFVFANAFYQAGLQFYDALLPSVSTAENRGRIGGLGVAVGYLGSFLAIGISLVSPRMGWTPATGFSLIAMVFLGFALPCFFWVKEETNPKVGQVWSLREMGVALRRTYETLRSSKEYPELRRFLIGRIFYTDPINTVIAVMTLYAINVASSSGVDAAGAKQVASLVLLGAVVFAILGGYVAGFFVDRWGARKVLRLVLVAWLFTFTLAALMGLLGLPWQLLLLVSSMAGVSLGGTWAADRPLMLELTPKHRLGEFYGLYNMVGRFAAIIGPAIWAVSMKLLQNAGWATLRAQGFSILLLLLLIVVSQRLLRPVLLQKPV
jgi:UMF1 family MFS transporter